MNEHEPIHTSRMGNLIEKTKQKRKEKGKKKEEASQHQLASPEEVAYPTSSAGLSNTQLRTRTALGHALI